MNKDLMMAILAMDAYNRGYDPGIEGLSDNTGTQIGNATIVSHSDNSATGEAVAESFYAVSYNYGGETIISYRGTDDFADLDDWFGGAGVLTDQARLAAEFYRSISGGSIYSANITLTRHSLGGGKVTVH